MNAFARRVWVLLLLLVPAGDACAQPALPEPTRGKVLLLDNDRILEGDIEKINGQYRVRRTIGELWIPAARAKRLCKDLDESYEIMKRQVNLRDADERLRLARWCQLNGLKNRALEEAKIALDMRPDHAESLNLVQSLQRFAISSSPAMATQHPARAAPPAVKPQVGARQALDVSNDAFAAFATRVQPILMNTCISCHGNGNGGNLRLVRALEGGARAAAQANLHTVLDYINFERPVLSPLLIKAVVAHGGAAVAPLKGRQSAPFQTVQAWVDQLVEGNPHIREIRQAEGHGGTSISAKKDYFNETFPAPDRTPFGSAPPMPAPLMPAAPPLPREPVGKTGEIISRPLPRFDEKTALPTPTLPAPGVPAPNLPPIPAPPPPNIAPMPPAGPRDPFDPAEFNSRPK